jgi:hypothetical protein
MAFVQNAWNRLAIKTKGKIQFMVLPFEKGR